MTTTQHRPRSRLPLLAILAVCLAPVIFAALAYYVPALGLRPAGTSNYGRLIEPQRPMPPASALALTDNQGQPVDLSAFKGQWLLISAGPGACPESCVRKLYVLRNSHASQGKEVERLNRIWFVTDDAPLNPVVESAYQGTIILRGDPAQLAEWLTVDESDPQAGLYERMWVVDPLGNLMMAFPGTDEPEEVRDDIRTLLKYSRIG